jgi:hypothetical protein
MKSIIFVLLMHAHVDGSTSPVGAFESLEQCRQAQTLASANEAAAFTCEAVTTAGVWSRKAQTVLLAAKQ